MCRGASWALPLYWGVEIEDTSCEYAASLVLNPSVKLSDIFTSCCDRQSWAIVVSDFGPLQVAGLQVILQYLAAYVNPSLPILCRLGFASLTRKNPVLPRVASPREPYVRQVLIIYISTLYHLASDASVFSIYEEKVKT